jgi:hypothetical protein
VTYCGDGLDGVDAEAKLPVHTPLLLTRMHCQ